MLLIDFSESVEVSQEGDRVRCAGSKADLRPRPWSMSRLKPDERRTVTGDGRGGVREQLDVSLESLLRAKERAVQQLRHLLQSLETPAKQPVRGKSNVSSEG
jgi:hypothetical protein